VRVNARDQFFQWVAEHPTIITLAGAAIAWLVISWLVWPNPPRADDTAGNAWPGLPHALGPAVAGDTTFVATTDQLQAGILVAIPPAATTPRATPGPPRCPWRP
jgi:hypothetical protein